MTDVPAGHGYGVVVVFPVLILNVICMTCCGIPHVPAVFRLTVSILSEVDVLDIRKVVVFILMYI